MYLHANAKLGLAGRLALVRAVEGGCSIRGAAALSASRRRRRIAGGIAGLRPARKRGRRSRVCSIARAVRAALRVSSPHELEEAICACRRQTGWGPRLVAGATGFAHSTVWKVLRRAGISRPPRAEQGAGPPLRVALPRRSAAHGHKPLRPLPAARPPRHRRPLAALAQLDEPRDTRRLRLRARDRRRPLPARLRRAPRRREGSDRRPASSSALSPSSPSHGIVAKRLMTDNAFNYVKNRSLRELLARNEHPTPDDEALPAAHQRQGRTLPPDDGTRVGLRPRLPLTSTPRPGAATLAPPLQHRRPHSSIGDRPPISRVHNVCG